MINNDVVNFVASATNYLRRVAHAATRGILAGGLITQIVEHFELEFNLEVDRLVDGKNKIYMDSLMHQGIISVDKNTYTTMICNKAIIYLPNPRKARVDVVKNWLCMADAVALGSSSDEEGDPDLYNHDGGDYMEEDIIPPCTHPTQHEAGSSSHI